MATTHPYLDWPGPIAFAHRGGSNDNPENTMRSFRHAVELGYRYLETDVQLTADGVLLAFHDSDLQRTCGRPERIAETPWAGLADARVGGSEPIPTFHEVLEEWPDARINVDCKADAAVEPLLAAILAHDAFDRGCVAAFGDRRIRRIRRLGGARLCTSAARGELGTLWATGASIGGQCAQVPVRRGRVEVVTPRFLARARRRGLAVHVWTIDDADEMHRLLDLGVDGIMTDAPGVLRDVLVARDAWVD